MNRSKNDNRDDSIYRLLFESASDAMFVADANTGLVIDANVAAERILDQPRDQIIGLHQSQLHPPEDDQLSRRNFVEAVEHGGEPDDKIVRVQRRNDTCVPAHVTSSVLDVEGRKIIYGCFRDASSRLRIEAALRESEERFRGAFETSAVAMVLAALDGPIQRGNLAALELFGYTEGEFKSLSWQNICHPDELSKSLDDLKKLVAGDIPIIQMITKGIRKNGDAIWINLNVSLIRDAKGEPKIMLGQIEDYSVRKQAEEALVESEERYRLVSELTSDLAYAYACKEDGGIESLWVSGAIEAVTGFSAREVSERGGWESIVHPDDLEGPRAQLKGLLSGLTSTVEYRVIRKDGEIRTVRDTARPDWDEQEQRTVRIFGALADITRQRAAEEAVFASEALHRETQRLAEVGGWEYEVENEITRWTDETYRLHEMVPGDEANIKGLRLDCYPAEARAKIEESLRRAVEEGVPFDLETPFLAAKGRSRWVRTTAEIVKRDGRIDRVVGNIGDVTERHNEEDATQQALSLLNATLDAIGDGILVVDLKGKIKVFNRRFVEMWKIPKSLLNAGDDVDALKSVLEQLAEPGEFIGGVQDPFQVPEATAFDELRFKDGRIFERFSRPQKVGDTIVGRVWSFHDATERMAAEGARRESEERYRDLVEKAGVGILIDDAQGNISYCNQTFVDVFGYALDEVKGIPIRSLVHPEDVDRVAEYHVDRMGGRPAPSQYEFRGIKSDGTILHLEVHTAPLRDDTSIVGSRSYVLDLTMRRRAEDAFRSEKASLERLFDSTPEAIVLTTANGRVMSVNSSFTKLFGYTREEAINCQINDLVASPDCREEADQMTQMVLEGREVEFETHRMRKDGSTVDVSVIGAPIMHSGEAIAVYAIYRDVSEHKRLESEFRHAQKMEAVGLLAGGIAHDFNNILQSIMGESELLLIQANDDNPERKRIESIKAAADRAAALTGQLLAFSRKQILRPETLDLNVVIVHLEKMIGRLIGENIQIESRLAPDLGPIKADQGQLEQVILNLAVNSRDAMPDGGQFTLTTANARVDFETASSLPGMQPGRYVTLVVSDTGVGMSVETRKRLFEPFFTTKDQGKGTGLGLATVYGIVGQSGGRIYAESEVGRGSTFTIYLPRVANIDETEPVSGPTIESVAGDETILLVEDDDTVRAVVLEMLGRLGYRVLASDSPIEALRIAQSYGGTIHLLLTDIVMPEMSGSSLAKRLCDLIPELHVLYMTGYTDETVVRHGVVESGFELLQKPFSTEDLALKVRAAIDREEGREVDQTSLHPSN